MINWYLFSSGVFMNFCKIWSSCHLRRISRLGSDSLNTLINGMISGKVAALIFSWRMSVKFLMVFADRLIERNVFIWVSTTVKHFTPCIGVALRHPNPNEIWKCNFWAQHFKSAWIDTFYRIKTSTLLNFIRK